MMVYEVETVDSAEAIVFGRWLASEEGILAGISSGAAAAVALRLAHSEDWRGKTLVVVLPDTGVCYLSTALFEGLDGGGGEPA